MKKAVKKAVVVTGASRGIGRAISLELANTTPSFYAVVMIARKSDTFDQACAEVSEVSGDHQIVKIEADLSDLDAATDIFDTLECLGLEVEILINNAGFTKPASINETLMADFERTMRVNLYAPFLLIQTALHRGQPLKQIINIASTAGVNGRAGWLSYSASKAAIINMSEVLREELKPFGIEVICLSPGRCATDLRKTLAPKEDPSTIMQPEQVAQIVSVMMSNSGSLIGSGNIVVRT